MDDYIDWEALKEAFEQIDVDVPEGWKGGRFCKGFGRKVVNEVIDSIPSANVEPVRHGRWKPVFDAEAFRGDPEAAAADEITGYECSICGRTCAFPDGNGEYILPDVCPGCWVKMDGGVENAPIIDAVPVVRCKDCEYSNKALYGWLWCTAGPCGGKVVLEDFYCKCGERRADNAGD